MERKAHLVNWELVCAGKEKGGLGLRKLVLLNKVLLGKWVLEIRSGQGRSVEASAYGKIWARRPWLED